MTKKIATMSMNDTKALLKKRLKSQIQSPDVKLKPICLIGHRGIGKTELPRQVVREVADELEMELGFHTISTSSMEPPELNGLAKIVCDGSANGKTVFAAPELLPKDGAGIIFFDEFNRTNVDIRNAMLNLIQDRSLNGNDVGDGWLFVFAGNPFGDMEGAELYDTSTVDSAYEDRSSQVIVSPTPNEVLQYLQGKYPENVLTPFLSAHPEAISLNGSGDCSPRTIEFAMRAMSGLTIKDNADEIRLELLVHFGVTTGTFVNNYLNERFASLKMIDVDVIYKQPEEAIKFVKEYGHDQSVMSELIRNLANEQTDRIISKFNPEQDIANNKYVYTLKERKAFWSFLKELSEENKLAFLSAFQLSDKSINFNFEMAWAFHFMTDKTVYEVPNNAQYCVITEDGKLVWDEKADNDVSSLGTLILRYVSEFDPNLINLLNDFKKVQPHVVPDYKEKAKTNEK